jgi:hypothetical protein
MNMAGILTDNGFNYLEINAYFDSIAGFFYTDFDSYDVLFNGATSSFLPMVKEDLPNFHIPLSVDVDNLVAENVNLNLFLSNMGGLEKKYTYRIKYKNNSYSQPITVAFPTNNDRISKDKLILSTLANASEIQSIEFLFGYDQFFYNMGLFVAVPDRLQFRATGYLPDHTPYISFDQNCRYTETFYDGKMNRHFVNDRNYIKNEGEMPKEVGVSISNTYYEYASNQCNIVSVTFVNSATAEVIKKNSLIVPGYGESFTVPPGRYSIYLDTNGPIGKASFGSQQITTTNMGAVVTDELLAGQSYLITVSP